MSRESSSQVKSGTVLFLHHKAETTVCSSCSYKGYLETPKRQEITQLLIVPSNTIFTSLL